MRIFLPRPAEGYEFCHPVKDADFEVFARLINGRAREHSWRPIEVEMVREDEGLRLAPAEAPWLGSHALILRVEAAERVKRLLTRWGELLPLHCTSDSVVVFNPTTVLDALDEGLSDLSRFSSGRLMRVKRYAWRKDIVGSAEIFKISNLRVSPTFFSEKAVAEWVAAGLRGVEWDPT